MKKSAKLLYEDILDSLRRQFPGREVIALSEAARYLDTKPDILKDQDDFYYFKIGGRYKVPVAFIARYIATWKGTDDERQG